MKSEQEVGQSGRVGGRSGGKVDEGKKRCSYREVGVKRDVEGT